MTDSQDYPPPPEDDGSADTDPGRTPQDDAPPTEQFAPGPYPGGEQAFSAYSGDAYPGGRYPPPGYPPQQWGGYPEGYSDPPAQQYQYPPQAYAQTGYAPSAPYGYPDQGYQTWPESPFDARQQADGSTVGGRRSGPLVAGAVTATLVVAAAVVLILGLVWPGFFNTTVLDSQATQHSIASVLSNDYQIDGVSAVSCPNRIEVSDGDHFTCNAVINGRTVTVTSMFDGDHGDFVVSQPAMP